MDNPRFDLSDTESFELISREIEKKFFLNGQVFDMSRVKAQRNTNYTLHDTVHSKLPLTTVK